MMLKFFKSIILYGCLLINSSAQCVHEIDVTITHRDLEVIPYLRDALKTRLQNIIQELGSQETTNRNKNIALLREQAHEYGVLLQYLRMNIDTSDLNVLMQLAQYVPQTKKILDETIENSTHQSANSLSPWVKGIITLVAPLIGFFMAGITAASITNDQYWDEDNKVGGFLTAGCFFGIPLGILTSIVVWLWPSKNDPIINPENQSIVQNSALIISEINDQEEKLAHDVAAKIRELERDSV